MIRRRYPMRYHGRGHGYPTTSYTHAGASVTTSSTTLIVANWQRFHVRIQNQGTASIFVRLDGGVATADSDAHEIVAGGPDWWAYTIPGSAVTAIAASGTQAVHIEWGGAAAPPVEVVASGIDVVVGGIQVVV